MSYLLYASSGGLLLALLLLALLRRRAFRDPRWRVFDRNSRQTTEGEIYNGPDRPVISKVKLVKPKTLRFTFLPAIQTASWEIMNLGTGVVTTARHADIPFPVSSGQESFRLTPTGRFFGTPIELTIDFYPKENYHAAGLGWPDNYHVLRSTLPFGFRQPYTLQDWVGLLPHDPDVLQARSILEDRINFASPPLQRMQDVFSVVVTDLQGAGGIPSDELQQASPLRTYDLMRAGTAKGWCENVALVYYLFANAAGVATRLVDMGGKFGPLKLTGHYVCESWIPERAVWCYVDPQYRVAYVMTPGGQLLTTLDIKRLADMGLLSRCEIRHFDDASGSLVGRDAQAFDLSIRDYLKGDLVLAYKFGYAKNRDFSRWRQFLFYPTLLYAPFPVPKLYRIKKLLLWIAIAAAVLTGVSGWWLLIDLPL